VLVVQFVMVAAETVFQGPVAQELEMMHAAFLKVQPVIQVLKVNNLSNNTTGGMGEQTVNS
jgi:hypothetical protein